MQPIKQALNCTTLLFCFAVLYLAPITAAHATGYRASAVSGQCFSSISDFCASVGPAAGYFYSHPNTNGCQYDTYQQNTKFPYGPLGSYPIIAYTCNDACPPPQVRVDGVCSGDAPKNNGQPNTCNATGDTNPIFLATGNKFQKENIYSAGAYSPLKFSIAFNGKTGNWTGTESPVLKYELYQPAASIFKDRLRFTMVDGREILLISSAPTRDPSTASVLPATDVYNSDRDGITAYRNTLVQSNNEYYQIAYNGGDKEYYNYAGKITKSVSKSGVTVTYSYTTNTKTVTDAYGNWIKVTYDTTKPTRFTQLDSSDGRKWRFTWNTAGVLDSVYFPDEDADDNNNPRKQYLYEDTRFPKALTGIIDEAGQRYNTWAYDSSGRAYYSAHGDIDSDNHRFEETTLQFNSDGTTTVIKQWDNGETKTATYQFVNINGYLATSSIQGDASTACSAANKSYTYDSNGFEDKLTDFNGNLTDRDFNTLGQEIRRTEGLDSNGNPTAVTRVYETDYDPSTNLVTETRLLGRVKNHYTYYANNRLQSRIETDLTTVDTQYYTSGGSRTWNYSYTYYDTAQLKVQKLQVDGPRTDVSDITEYNFDSQGNLSQIKNALNQTTTYSNFTAQGLPQTVVDVNGNTTALQYYARGWLKSSSLTSSEGTFTTNYTYYANGLLKRTTLPDGSWLEYGYNAARHLTSITNQLGEVITYSPNKKGDWKTESIQSSTGTIMRQRTRVFDELGRLKKVLGNNNQFTEYYYDNETNRTGMDQHRLNPSSGTEEVLHTLYGLDALNRTRTITDPLNNTIVTEHDAQDNVITVTDPRQNTTTFVYNGFGEKIQEVSPDAGTRYFGYDTSGNLTLQQDANERLIHYTYDALNRITSEAHDADSTLNVTYYYDEGVNGVGHLTSVSDASTRLDNSSNVTSYVYSGRGNLSSVTTTLNGATYQTSYTYDAIGNVATITYPSGRIVEYVRAPGGHVTSVVTRASANGSNQIIAQDIQYLPFGPVKGLSYGNGLYRNLGYDLDYRLQSIVTGDANQSIQNTSFGYDWLNNITSITDGNNPNNSQAFIYDSLQRLADATGSYGHYVYGYDAVGNRSSLQLALGGVTQFSETYHYPSDSNRLDLITRSQGGSNSTRNLGYDDAGNITTDSRSVGLSRQYNFGANNRMSGIVDNGVNQASYVYNALGQRVLKTLTGHTPTVFQFGLNGELLSEQQGSEQSREYIYLNGQIIAANITPALSTTGMNTLTVGGTTQTFTPTIENPIGNFTFNAIAGQSYVLNLANDSLDGNTDVSVYRQDGTLLTTLSVNTANGSAATLSLNNLDSSGTYSVRITPSASATSGSVDVGVQLANLVATLTANGSSSSFSATSTVQNGRYTFSGAAGTRYSLLVNDNLIPGDSVISVIRPDGSRLGFMTVTGSSVNATSAVLDLPALPVAGTYTVFVSSGAAGTLNISLKQDAEGTITVGSTALPISLAAGQNGAYTFTATSGQNLGVGVSALALSPSDSSGAVVVKIYKPDGSLLQTCGTFTGNSGGGTCDLQNLPVTGTYKVAMDPATTYSASLTLTVSSDLTASLTANAGTATAYTTTRAGQNARFSFSGTAATNYALLFTDDTFVGNTSVSVLKPDGTLLSSTSLSYASGTGTTGSLDLLNLPSTGTYTVYFTPATAAAGSLNVRLTQDATGTLTVGGTATSGSLNSGQNGTYSFSGTAGQNLGLGVSSLSMTPSDSTGSITISLYKPDGTLWQTCGTFLRTSGSASCDLSSLPSTGTYKVRIDPLLAYSASFSMTLSADVTNNLYVGGLNTFSTARPGQNGRYTIALTSGKAYTVKITNDTYVGSTTITVLKPDGTPLTSGSVNYTSGSGTSGNIAVSTLSTTGNYVVFMSPEGSATGSLYVQVTNP